MSKNVYITLMQIVFLIIFGVLWLYLVSKLKKGQWFIYNSKYWNQINIKASFLISKINLPLIPVFLTSHFISSEYCSELVMPSWSMS